MSFVVGQNGEMACVCVIVPGTQARDNGGGKRVHYPLFNPNDCSF